VDTELKEYLEDIKKDVANIKDWQSQHDARHAKQMGFIGGAIFISSALIAAVQLGLKFFRHL